MKNGTILARYDAYILKPERLAYLVLIILFVVRHQWVYAGASLFMEVVTSLVRTSLYPSKDYHQFAEDTLRKAGDVGFDDSVRAVVTYEARTMSRTGAHLSLAFGTAAFALLLHRGVRWWFAGPLALAAGLAYMMLPLALFVLLSNMCERKTAARGR